MRFDVAAALDAAVAQREATPGRPEEGPYPASIDECADEVVEWVYRFERDFHRGFGDMVAERLIGRVGAEPTAIRDAAAALPVILPASAWCDVEDCEECQP